MGKLLVLLTAALALASCSSGRSSPVASDDKSDSKGTAVTVTSKDTVVEPVTGDTTVTMVTVKKDTVADPVTGAPTVVEKIDTVVKVLPKVRKFSLSLSSPQATGRKTLGKRAVATTEPTDFDMGLIRTTRSYQFLLVNNSTDSLTDIVVSTSNSKFSVVPAKIRSIGAPTMQIGNNVIIQVTAIHGVSEGGSYADPITDLDDTSRVVVTGKFGDSTFTVGYTIRVVPAWVEIAIKDTILHEGWLATHFIASAVSHNCPITFKTQMAYQDSVNPFYSYNGYAITYVRDSLVTVDTLPRLYHGMPRMVEGVYALYYDCVDNVPGEKTHVSDKTLVPLSFFSQDPGIVWKNPNFIAPVTP